MPKWRLFYHFVWATKGRVPMIDGEIEPVVLLSIKTTCRSESLALHAVGIMPDHVHLVVSVPPSVALSTFVGRLKGASAHAINASAPGKRQTFAWQAEYGVFSFSEKNLHQVVDYVVNQRDRHHIRDLWLPFEEDGVDQPASAGLSGSARGL